MNNIPPQEPRPVPPAASPPVPVVADSPKRFRAKIWESVLMALGALAQWLPTAAPQLQHDFPAIKWGSVLMLVGFIGMLLRNVKEAGNVQATNFTPTRE